MPRLKSVEDLRELRERLKGELKTRSDTSTTISVGMGTCGISAGARGVLDAVAAELESRGIEAHLSTVGCIGMCSKEPLLDIQQGDEPRVTYGQVSPEMVRRIVDEHLVQGKVVEEWVVGRLAVGGDA